MSNDERVQKFQNILERVKSQEIDKKAKERLSE